MCTAILLGILPSYQTNLAQFRAQEELAIKVDTHIQPPDVAILLIVSPENWTPSTPIAVV